MAHWLMKSEPDAWSWDQQVKAAAKGTEWTGVRNHSAKLNLMKMKKGDRGFFYHSNEDRAIVGLMKIVGLWHPDPDDETGKFGMVDFKAVKALNKPVTLAEVKATPALAKMSLVTSMRLSVQPVTDAEWKLILKMSGTKE